MKRRREKLPKWRYEFDCRKSTTFGKYTTRASGGTVITASRV